MDQLKTSTNDKDQGQRFAHGHTLVESLVNKPRMISDARVPMSGLSMFKLWFGQRNLPAPFSQVWQYDLGKFIVPTMFMDVDSLRAVADKYDSISRVVRGNKGEALLIIQREEFQEVFDLYEPSVILEPIDLEELKKGYEKTRYLIKAILLPSHLAKVTDTQYYIGQSVEVPFPIDSFAHYFKATFFTLCQILGFHPGTIVPKSYMHMGIQIQHPHFAVIYDFSPYLVDKIREGLLQIKKGGIDTSFSCT